MKIRHWFNILVFTTLVNALIPAHADTDSDYQDALSLYRQGQLRESLTALDRIIQSNPEYAAAYYSRCVVNYDLGALRDALNDCTQAQMRAPDHSQAWYMRGLIRSQNFGDNQGSLADFSRAIDIDPDYGAAYLKRGNARNRLGDLAGSIEDYSQAIRIDQNDADAFFNRGVALFNSGNVEQAKSDLKQAETLYQHQGNNEGKERAGNALTVIRQSNQSDP
ncbi:Tetratricopeptide repeat-containing protein [Nitrosomonas sp. Nm51]|uniref:tetratricopeptide repeat protein n=1 Tax=Nitrosomonas sp. Nm51 TaxID=133720 RepID=UPI0008C01F3B|nr:tetratricopeptide repeat protein [Nitrosomonas sp. Nm51]SEQ89755.1 Tetratricopeptide repeat-containing protein [Nitrosomonas sp. Nm51]